MRRALSFAVDLALLLLAADYALSGRWGLSVLCIALVATQLILSAAGITIKGALRIGRS